MKKLLIRVAFNELMRLDGKAFAGVWERYAIHHGTNTIVFSGTNIRIHRPFTGEVAKIMNGLKQYDLPIGTPEFYLIDGAIEERERRRHYPGGTFVQDVLGYITKGTK